MSLPPSAMGARSRDPEPSEPHGLGPRVKICSWSCLSWLHPLRSWSLRQTRGGSRCFATLVSLCAQWSLRCGDFNTSLVFELKKESNERAGPLVQIETISCGNEIGALSSAASVRLGEEEPESRE